MNKEVILITSYFPYSLSEAFLETEIQYWSEVKDIQLTVLPTELSSNKREMPENILVNDLLTDKQKSKKLYLLRSLMHAKFYKELLTYVIQNPRRLKYTLSSFLKYLWIKDKLEVLLAKKDTENLIFYTYWHTEATYALQSLKQKYSFVLLTRTHGFDLYEERKKHQYMPFRRQFLTLLAKPAQYRIALVTFRSPSVKRSRMLL